MNKHIDGNDMTTSDSDDNSEVLESPKAPAEALRQQLAAIEHERWADWQKWCHQVLRDNLNKDGLNIELEKILLRWDKQIATPYDKLSDSEKASDMEQVDRYWPLVTAYAATVEREGRRDELQTYFDTFNDNNFTPMQTIDYCERRLAALQGPIQGDAPDHSEAA